MSPTAKGALFEKTAPLDPPQKLFIHGQSVLRGFQHRAPFSPSNPLLRGVLHRTHRRGGVCHIRVSSCILPHYKCLQG